MWARVLVKEWELALPGAAGSWGRAWLQVAA
jgi:hypothetical protein